MNCLKIANPQKTDIHSVIVARLLKSAYGWQGLPCWWQRIVFCKSARFFCLTKDIFFFAYFLLSIHHFLNQVSHSIFAYFSRIIVPVCSKVPTDGKDCPVDGKESYSVNPYSYFSIFLNQFFLSKIHRKKYFWTQFWNKKKHQKLQQHFFSVAQKCQSLARIDLKMARIRLL